MGLTFDALLYFKFMGTLVISWCLVQDQQQVYTYHRFTSHELSEWHTEVYLKRVLSTKENRYRKVQLVIPALLQSRTKLLGRFPIMSTFLCSKTISKTSHLCEKKTLSSGQCCFLQTPSDQAFFWLHNNIAFRRRGRGKNRYSYDV